MQQAPITKARSRFFANIGMLLDRFILVGTPTAAGKSAEAPGPPEQATATITKSCRTGGLVTKPRNSLHFACDAAASHGA
jgi:hypothetical protein